MKHAERGFTLIELMIVIAIIAVIAAIAIPGLLQSQRASNERSASSSLKTIASAETDFRANDRDANKVNDFWTYDVKGLYTLTPYTTVGTGSITDTLRLIDLGMAAADSALTTVTGPHCVAITAPTITAPKAGFWYQALVSDMRDTPESYLTNTQGTAIDGSPVSAAAYHLTKFGFIAYPDAMTTGRFAYILCENNTVLRSALTASIKASAGSPPGLLATPFNVLPNETTMKAAWGKLD